MPITFDTQAEVGAIEVGSHVQAWVTSDGACPALCVKVDVVVAGTPEEARRISAPWLLVREDETTVGTRPRQRDLAALMPPGLDAYAELDMVVGLGDEVEVALQLCSAGSCAFVGERLGVGER